MNHGSEYVNGWVSNKQILSLTLCFPSNNIIKNRKLNIFKIFFNINSLNARRLGNNIYFYKF